jgi:DNA-binding transcriptional LysR family regulator
MGATLSPARRNRVIDIPGRIIEKSDAVNIHHLELFYYVARHGGIMEAVRKIPYGIQQPAVSAQIIQLERTLGVKLFQRRPFELTAAGAKLYAYIQPFFGNLSKVASELQGKASRFIRLGASGPVLRYHLPRALRQLHEAMPDLAFNLSEAYEPQLLHLFAEDEIDLAITVFRETLPSGLNGTPLITIPLTLLVPKNSKVRDAEELWARDKIEEPLISLPFDDGIARSFQSGLQKLNVDWPPGFVVSTLELVETYVGENFGIGASIVVPGMKPSAAVRALPLPGFEPLRIGAVWRGDASPLVRTLVEAFRQYVRGLEP